MSSSKRLSQSQGGKLNSKRVSNGASSASSPTPSRGATLSRSASMKSTGFVSPNGKSSSGDEQEEGEDDSTANGSKPSNVWCEKHKLTPTSTGDQTTVTLVVSERVFPKVKFVDRDIDLMFSTEQRSICQFVIGRCNLQTDISLPNWWKQVHKYVSQTINRLRNDRNTAMKWAALGKMLLFACNTWGMSNY
jgi:hypothetical protein